VKIGILLPGFSSDENDWAIPVQLNLMREMACYDDVRVLALRYPHRRDIYEVHGATVYSMGVGQVRGVKRLLLWWDALRTLRRLHRQKPFDVLHAMWADETGLVAAWAGRWLNIPVITSIAGGELVRFDDIAYGLQRGAMSRWIVRQALMGADRVVVACDYVRRLVDIPQAKIANIVLGVDTRIFCPDDTVRESNRLVHVASLVGVKDQATLLRALARLKDIYLDVVGTGSEQQRLSALAAELAVADRVRFVGAVHHLDLPLYFRRAALNVLSSRHEGLGMVTLEAAACGTPTVSTAVGLLPDCPEMGVVVPVSDDAALAEAIQTLLDNPTQREQLAREAVAMVNERFTIQNTVEQFRSLYQELAGEKPSTKRG
jgi:glycosyltransferase involved in cell wall biosynthesis